MLTRLLPKIALIVAALTLASPTLAAKRHAHPKAPPKPLTGACLAPGGRCIADCDVLKWCQMYVCNNRQSTPVPFWRCLEPSGLCLAPHCKT